MTCNAIAPAARTRMTEGAYGGDLRRGTTTSTSGTRTTSRRWSRILVSDAAAHISGKVFGVQGDAVELYQPLTSVGRDREPRAAGGSRRRSAGRIGVLFAEADMEPGATNGMARLRYTMTDRG